jgi:hypothetical protein
LSIQIVVFILLQSYKTFFGYPFLLEGLATICPAENTDFR